MRDAKGAVNPAAPFFGENMNLDSRMRFMGEKPFNMPSFKDPRELTHAVNELINDNDNIGDSALADGGEQPSAGGDVGGDGHTKNIGVRK